MHSAQANDVVYAPAFCEPAALTLFVKNTTQEPQRLWTQVRNGDDLQELYYDLDPRSEMKIRGSQFLNSKMGFSIKSWTANSLQITADCTESIRVPLSEITSSRVSHYLPVNTKAVKIHLLNLFLKSNSVKLKAFNKEGTVVEKKESLSRSIMILKF